MPALKSAKHEAFARAIVEGKPGRAAYAAAGYQAKPTAADTNASRLLKNAQVSTRIAELKDAAAEASVLKARDVVDELRKLAFANPDDWIKRTPGGDPFIDLSEMTREQMAAIGEITVEDYVDGRGKGARDVRKIKIKPWDKRAALVDLGNYFGIFKPQKIEHSGPGGGPIETKETGQGMSELELARRIAFALEKAARKSAKPAA